MQEAMIINDEITLALLNSKLEEGWVVAQTCPMPSSCGVSTSRAETHVTKMPPSCLVIIDDHLIEEK